jgi:hypothetical protein
MKKYLASFAVLAFLLAFSLPVTAVENVTVTTEQVADEKPKKKDKKKSEKGECSKECTKEKKSSCSDEKKDKA